MEEDGEVGIGLSAIMKFTGILPIMLGTAFLLTPKTAIAVGPHLTEYGIFVSMYVGVFAIFIGLTQLLVAIYVKENLHIFGRLFALGLAMTVLLEIYGWTSGLMEFELKFLFATMIPVSATLVLLMYSITPEQSEMESEKMETTNDAKEKTTEDEAADDISDAEEESDSEEDDEGGGGDDHGNIYSSAQGGFG